MRRVTHLESLCGLLHDIGKPLLRYIRRVERGLEEGDEEVLKLVEELITREEGGRRITHEDVGYELVRKLIGVKIGEACRLFEQALRHADRIAAAERGLREYAFLRDEWESVESRVSRSVGLGYSHESAPMLSPSWILTKLGYADFTGPCGRGRFSADAALGKLLETFRPLVEALDERDVEKLSASLSSLLGELAGKPLWFSPQPLTEGDLAELSPKTYPEALKGVSYLGVSKWLVRGLKLVRDLYGGRISRGYVDTLDVLLRYTLMSVPAAVYMALLPDTSLYSHSKLVAAYSSVLSLGTSRFRFLVLDLRKIQDFVASPVAAKAASRVIRGRSFLAELVSLSLLNYALELYGGLPYANVVTSEGGTLTVIVPAWSEERERVVLSALESTARSTYPRLKGLWFTAALSRDFGLEDVDYVANLKSAGEGTARRGLLALLEDLERELAIRKTIDEARSTLSFSEAEIEGFDAITREPVTREELRSGFGLRASANADYSGLVSGWKLGAEDVVSGATHLSLVAGTCLRNMLFLVSVYAYRHTEDEIPEPAADGIREVLDSIRSRLGERLRRTIAPQELYFKGVEFDGYGFDVGLLPLEPLGALHVMVSSTGIAVEPLAEEVLRSDLLRAAANAVAFLVGAALEKLAKAGTRARVEVRLANTGVEFVEVLEHERLSETLRGALEKGVDVHVGVVHAGTYHPSAMKGSEIVLVDLDAYNLVALVKADADALGEVKKLLSFSPTRLSSLSDLLTTVIAGKAHIVALRYAGELSRSSPGEPRGPIMLYSGGDDVALYGYWIDVLAFLRRVYSEVFGALYPLSFTAAVALERSDYPLLELYRRVVKALDDGKREARGWIFLPDVSSPRPVLCGDGRFAVTASLRPSDGAIAPGPGSTTPLEFFTSLARALEALESSRELREGVAGYKRELRMVSWIGSLGPEEIVALGRALSGLAAEDLDALYGLTRRSVALSYASARREAEFKKLGELLSSILGVGVKLHHEAGEDVKRSLLVATCSKTFIDILLLYLSPFSREIRKPEG